MDFPVFFPGSGNCSRGRARTDDVVDDFAVSYEAFHRRSLGNERGILGFWTLFPSMVSLTLDSFVHGDGLIKAIEAGTRGR